MSKPSGTNSPTSSSGWGFDEARLPMAGVEIETWRNSQEKRDSTTDSGIVIRTDLRSPYLFSETYCGGYSGEDPPLPIPNREVKLTIADGTAPPGGRVGSCHFFIRHPVIIR